jgi:Asparagine synthase (glutamine-hydrolyzing)
VFRYIAFVWNEGDADQSHAVLHLLAKMHATGSDWRHTFKRDGLHVFFSTSKRESRTAYPLAEGQGVVLGTVFERSKSPLDDSTPRQPIFREKESARLIATGGRALIEEYWGWYVAFLFDAETGIRSIIRGPMGDLPCFSTSYRGVALFFSTLEDCLALNVIKFTIDWKFITLQAGFGYSSRIGSSALKEVTAVEGGECIQFNQQHTSNKIVYWNPCAIARLQSIACPNEAAKGFRATTRASVHAWASQHDSVLHGLSGGFDSSVVLCCLSDAPNRPNITALNFFSEGAKSDERNFARAVTQHTSTRLVEMDFDTDVHMDVIQNVARTPAPVHDVLDWSVRSGERRLAQEYGATAMFKGSQGDVIYQYNALMTPAADYLHLNGVDAGFFKALFDVAWRYRVSVWKVLRWAVTDGVLRRPKGTWNYFGFLLREGVIKDRSFVTQARMAESIEQSLQQLSHPWLRDVDDVPIGKLYTIAVLTTEGFFDAHFRTPDDPIIISPLISQPLTEFSLRVPTYLNVLNGWDRAMARRAFAQDLPLAITQRSSKGSPKPWLKVAVARNATFVREFLMGGVLVQRGIIDAQKLEAALPGSTTTAATDGHGIMNLLYTEAWLRSWDLGSQSAAA